ncbi:arfaptin-2-like [Stylophora pistillata]|uniref:arfaptin-2-like n=1 Tax=Stylophora pistillata TaxID=50429 RepID=UPI000C0577E1|nr:arfaptin-2-like [Stylophora pistillata]
MMPAKNTNKASRGPATSPAPWHSSGGTTSNGHPTSQALIRANTSQKIDHLRKWSISTYKFTRQYLSERFGKGTRTVDKELEGQILLLKETQVKYVNVLKLAKQMTNHLENMVQSQRGLSDAFADLGVKSPELQGDFNCNAEYQRLLVKNGEVLLGALKVFTSNLTTLVHKTIEDSIMTAKAYEFARIEYDAYRTDLESIQAGPRTAATVLKAEEAKQKYDVQKDKFDRLRSDLVIKIRFLEENKVKVMHKQLSLFQNATTAYFAGNKEALDDSMKEFHNKHKTNDGKQPFILEH